MICHATATATAVAIHCNLSIRIRIEFIRKFIIRGINNFGSFIIERNNAIVSCNLFTIKILIRRR